jgi:hypothetical protein
MITRTFFLRILSNRLFHRVNLEIPDDEETPDSRENSSTEREARSHIDRVIPIPQSGK